MTAPGSRPSDSDDPAAAWRELCQRLADLAGEVAATDPAEGVRHLARQTALTLEEQLEHADTQSPSFLRWNEPWRQWGAPNPDNVYLRAWVDPGATYRVWANVAGVRDLLIAVHEGDMSFGENGVFAERSLAELEVADDGGLELLVSAAPQKGNWLPLDARGRLIFIRQYQHDWEHDALARFSIERIDGRGVPPPRPSPADVAAAVRRAAEWTERSIRFWAPHSFSRSKLPINTVTIVDPPPGSAPHIQYGIGRWAIEPGHALVLTIAPSDAPYWTWVLQRYHWYDAGDFASRQTSLNHVQAHRDRDGSVRLVVSATDPEAPNWIDTGGLPEGRITYRQIGGTTRPEVSTEVLPLAQVRAHLPADHPVVTQATRRGVLARRRAAALRRYV